MAANVASLALARRGVCGAWVGGPPWVIGGCVRGLRRRLGRPLWVGRGYATAWEHGVSASGARSNGENGETDKRDVVGPMFKAMLSDDPRQLYELVGRIQHRGTKNKEQLLALRPTEFEELVQSLDPTRVHHQVDLLSGLCLAPAMIGYGFADHLVNVRGARRVYTRAFATICTATEARVMAGIPTPPGVFTALLRLAGAATRPDMGPWIRGLALVAGRGWDGTEPCKFHGALYTEFLKTTFLTEPLYYCYDETWVRTRPEDMLWHTIRIPQSGVRKLDRIRVGVSRGAGHAFGRDPEPRYDALHRRVSRFRAMRHAMPMSRLHAATPDEELLCAAISASARSGRRMYVLMILEAFYGIETRYDKETGELVMRGGFPMGPESPLRPTGKLLAAVGRALGSSADAASAMKLVNYLSHFYGVPVPREVWSEWIRWAHIHSALPARQEWKVVKNKGPNEAGRRMTAVVKALEESGHGFAPDFGDLLIVAKKRIVAVRLDEAMDPLRRAKAMYDEKLRGVESAAAVEAAAWAQGLRLPGYTSRGASFGHLAVERGVMYHMLQSACKAWLNEVRTKERYREHTVVAEQDMTVMVPEFVAEFWEVLPQKIKYHTRTGAVEIEHDVKRVEITRKRVRSPNVRVGVNTRVRSEAASFDDDEGADGEEGDGEGLYGGYWDQQAQPGNRYWQDQGPHGGHVDAPRSIDVTDAEGTPADGGSPAYEDDDDDGNFEWVRETHVFRHASRRPVRSPVRRLHPLPEDWREWVVDTNHALVVKEDGKVWVDNVRRDTRRRAH